MSPVDAANGPGPGGVGAPPRRWRGVVGWSVALVVVAVAGVWAGGLLARPAATAATAAPATYTVVSGTVGFSQSFSATAAWGRVFESMSPASGTVTSVDVPGDRAVVAGDVVFTVDERPVVAAAGSVPAYRDMAQGDSGADVRQLQQLLVDRGASLSVDGRFGAGTWRAVVAWQKAVGFTADGVVHLGDVVFVADLPRLMVADDGLRVGVRIEQGAPAVWTLADAPAYTVTLSQGQATVVDGTAQVVVGDGDGALDGVVASTTDNADGTVSLVLTAPDGGPLCAERCAQLVPTTKGVNLTARFVVIPSTTGPMVPVSAIRTTDAGQTYLTTADGATVDVRVLASSGGLAVVDGVDVGTVISTPGA